MCGLIVCLSATVLGVDYGWQPVAGGGIEYIIQIEPEMLDSLKDGHDLFSDLPPSMRGIRSYRITVGTGRLPHHGEPPPVPAGQSGIATDASSAAAKPAGAAADVDLSQLPGPIVGPALILHPPANRLAADEPPLLSESDAKPLTNRVAGYHGKTEAPAADTKKHASPAVDEHGKKSNPTASTPGAAAAEPAAAGNENPASKSKPAPLADRPANGAAAIQIGLFASLCANAFLLWVTVGQRSSYRSLVRRAFDQNAKETSAL